MGNKKILIRGGIAPYEVTSPRLYIRNRIDGQNVGNLVYSYGVFRALMTEKDNPPIVDGYQTERYGCADDEIDWINETCSAFIIPLADAFRQPFCKHLRLLRRVIKKLKIPCVVVGVGVKAPMDSEPSFLDSCNKDVKSFVNAVLDHSAIVGVRGEYTARYMEHLGYIPEKDFTIIGCPSIFCKGDTLPIGSNAFPASGGGPGLDPSSKIIVTNSVFSSRAVHRFMNRVMEEQPNYTYIPQLLAETRSAFYGKPIEEDFFMKDSGKIATKPEFPTLDSPCYQEDKVRLMFNLRSWSNTVRGSELSVGPRLHGGIMCMLSGVPTLTIPRDARTLEVCEYLKTAHVREDQITDETTLSDLIEKVDFQAISRAHKAHFEHYCDFLDANGLEHTLRRKDIFKTSPLDEVIKPVKYLPAQQPYQNASAREHIRRDTWFKVEEIRAEVVDQLKEKTELVTTCAQNGIKTAKKSVNKGMRKGKQLMRKI